MDITKLSIERPTLLTVIFSVFLFFGIIGYFKLTYELVPKFNPPVLTVATIYPGAAPGEVEREVSIPIEDALSSLENLDVINTISTENFSLLRMEMKQGTDIDFALQDASRKLQAIADKLPAAANKPVLSRFDFNDLPVMRIALFSNRGNNEFTTFTEDKIIPDLKRLGGVSDVKMNGGSKEIVMVSIDPNRLAALNVTPLQILKALGSANRNVPAGFLESDFTRTGLKFSGEFNSLETLRDLVIFESPEYGVKVRLSDVAEIYETTEDPKVITRLNGKPALGIEIKKQSDANAVVLSREVLDRLDQIKAENADKGFSYVVAADTSVFTLDAANAVMEDLLLAILLVSLVMLVFLHSLRNAFIVLIAIPVSIISTFMVMNLLGYSLNLLSLLGLSLAIGILVDDSIVVIENIHRHMAMGKQKAIAAYEGRMEIGFTAISITMIDIIVFVPVILASGMVADLLRQFSVVIVTSTLMSLFVSFTITPFLSSRFGMGALKDKKGFGKKFVDFTTRIIDRTGEEVVGWATWALNNKIKVVFIAFVLFAGSILLIPTGFIGLEFTKAGDRSEFIMEIELEKTATLATTNKVSKQVEQLLLQYKEVEVVFANTGITSSGRIESNTTYLSEIFVRLIDKSKRDFSSAEFTRHIKKRILNEIPGVKVRPIEINITGLRDDDAVQVSLLAANRDSLKVPAERVYKLLDEIPGSTELQSSYDPGKTGIELKANPEKMDALGIDPVQAGVTLRTLVSGNRDFVYREDNKLKTIQIISAPRYRAFKEDATRLSVINNKGKIIPFSDFTEVIETNVPGILERTNRTPSITIKSQVLGRPAGTVGNELKEKINDEKIAQSTGILWGGATRRTGEALATLAGAFAISIFLVYLVLVALYNSYVYPLAVLLTIPLAIIGAFTTLALTGQSLSIFSVMGLIMLIGLVGKNAILIVDFANNLRKSGHEITDAVITAVRLRFRPVLMTTLVIVIGLLPVALASGAGSEWKNGLAWTLIGGLTSSMILTLVVVPVVYHSLEKLLAKRRNRKNQ